MKPSEAKASSAANLAFEADCVLTNLPFNDSDWRGELFKEDKRWIYGVPPAGKTLTAATSND